MTKTNLSDVDEMERVRAEYEPVLGRDHFAIVLWYCGLKLAIKFFSLSGLFCMVATGIILDLADIGRETKDGSALTSWYPWAMFVTAWLNWSARKEFKRLVGAVSKWLENRDAK